MQEILKQARQDKGMLNFGAVPNQNWANAGTGVNYLASTAGSQVYSASSLVAR